VRLNPTMGLKSVANVALRIEAFDASVILMLLCITLYFIRGFILRFEKKREKNKKIQVKSKASSSSTRDVADKNKDSTSGSFNHDTGNEDTRKNSFQSESSCSETASQDEEDSSVQDQDQLEVDEESELREEVLLGAPKLPYLRIRNKLNNSTPARLCPNAKKVQEVKSDYVTSGSALMCLRLKDLLGKDVESYDYYDRFFKGRKRNLEFQLQVTLKNEPRGIIYLGGEMPRQMQLGLVTKGLCKAILAVTNRLSSHAHASFGKKMNETKLSEKELPHIVFPLFSAATQLMVTRAGDTPPKVGDDIPETPEAKKLRKKQGVNLPGDIKAGDTITFSLNTMYVDLIRWKVINIPGLKDLDLCLFWDTMPLSIVMYDTAEEAPSKERHFNKYKRYYLNFEMENTAFRRPAKGAEPWFRLHEETSSKDNNDVGGVEPDLDSFSSGGSKASLGSMDSLGLEDEDKGQNMKRGNKRNVRVDVHIPAVVEYSVLVENGAKNVKVRRQISLAVFCANKQKRDDKNARCYIHKFTSFTSTDLPECLRDLVHKNEFKSMESYPWKLENLRSKLDFGFANAGDANQIRSSWIKSSLTVTLLKANERKHMGVSVPSKLLTSARIVSECPVLHAEKEIKWCEKWAMILAFTANTHMVPQERCCVALFKCNSSKPSCVISCNDIISVIEIDSQPNSRKNKTFIPFSTDYPALEIETLGRVYTLGFSNKNVRSEFRDKLSGFLEEKLAAKDLEMIVAEPEIDDDLLLFQTDSINAKYVDENDTYFGANKRVIVNARRLHFGCFPTNEYFHKNDKKLLRRSNSFSKLQGRHRRKSLINEWFSVMFANGLSLSVENTDAQNPINQHSSPEPWEQSANLLRAALKLVKAEPPSQRDFITVCELASSLKSINMAKWSNTMTEEHKMCFFLNIYHALRIHATFILGAPSSIFGWDRFGQKISYVIGGMVFSLAEIEHCILRKPLSTVKILFVDINYNSSAFTQLFELKKREPRINLCLNYGNLSSASRVPVFELGTDAETSAKKLDSLLAKASQEFLDEQLIIDIRKKVIRIPKICSWYAKDFFEVGTKETGKRPLAHALYRYMSPTMQQKFMQLCIESDFVVKIRSFHFTQRVGSSIET